MNVFEQMFSFKIYFCIFSKLEIFSYVVLVAHFVWM